MIESQIRETIFDIRNGVNNTLESIPLVNVLKRIIERTTPLQVILETFLRFFESKLLAYTCGNSNA